MFPPYWNRSIDLKCKSVSWVFYSFIMIFSIWVLFPTNLDNSQDNTGKKVVMWFWDESKLSSLYLVISHEHWRFTGQQGKGGDNRYAVLNLGCLDHILNRSACNYQTVTRWDLPRHGAGIWLSYQTWNLLFYRSKLSLRFLKFKNYFVMNPFDKISQEVCCEHRIA